MAPWKHSPTPGPKAWSSGVRVESKLPKTAQWRPPASKSPLAKSFVSGGNLCKRLIFLKWHGRGRRFEPVQVHQNVSNTRSPTTSQDVVGVQRDGSAKASFRIRTDPRKTLLSDSA